MALETIWDAVAKLSATVTGIRAGYAAVHSYLPDGSETVPTGWPARITATPIVLVFYDGSTFEAGHFESVAHTFRARIYTGADDRMAYSILAPMFVRFTDVFRNHMSLYDTCTEAFVTGSAGFQEITISSGQQDVPDARYLAQDIGISAEEITPRDDYSLTP